MIYLSCIIVFVHKNTMPEKPFPNMVADLAGNGCINGTSILPGWRRVFCLENTRESVHFFSAGKINVQGDALFFFLEQKMCGGAHFIFFEKENVRGCALFFRCEKKCAGMLFYIV
jgi:hypothetical protein